MIYLNKKLLQYRKTDTPLCSFCKIEAEISFHFFYECSTTKKLLNQLKLFFATHLDFADLKSQTAIIGFINELDDK